MQNSNSQSDPSIDGRCYQWAQQTIDMPNKEAHAAITRLMQVSRVPGSQMVELRSRTWHLRQLQLKQRELEAAKAIADSYIDVTALPDAPAAVDQVLETAPAADPRPAGPLQPGPSMFNLASPPAPDPARRPRVGFGVEGQKWGLQPFRW